MPRYVFLDTETTGLDPHTGGHRIIELACIEYKDTQPTGNVFNLQLNPEGKKSTKGAFQVHKISSEVLVDKPLFKDVHEQLISLIKDAHLVIYNADFDLKFLNSELNRINYPSTVNDICEKVICAMDLATQKFGGKRISQDNACKRYNIDISQRTTHSAYLDSSLCAELFFKLIDKDVKPLKSTPQENKHRPTKALSIPRAYKSKENGTYVQQNFCKNSECENFGIVAKNPTYEVDGKLKRGLGNDYKLTSNRNKKEYLLTCKLCGQSTVMINNRAYTKEVERLSLIGLQIEPSCSNSGDPSKPYGERHYYIPYSAEIRKGEARLKPKCENVGKGIFSFSELYKLSGKTKPVATIEHRSSKKLNKGGKPISGISTEEKIGSQRIQCKTCDTRFSVKLDPQQRHYLRDINLPLFNDMMNKGIINRAEQKFGISAKVIYAKIDFFYQQALAFDAYHKLNLDFAVATKILNISSDRQHYLSNWGDHNMPLPTPIINTSTVDNGSGYVFASTINFDFSSDYSYIKKEHKGKKEFNKESYFRRFSQYVLSDDEANEPINSSSADVEMQLPQKGLLVHQTYSILSHFEVLKETLKYSGRVNLYADNDAGFKTAICGVFSDWIAHGKLNAFQVFAERAGGHQLLDKSTAQRLKEKDIELQHEFPELNKKERLTLLWQDQLSNRVTMPGTRSEWIVSPNFNSHFAGVLPLSNIKNKDIKQITNLLESASLHGVDNWFQIIRRHLNMLERPVTSGTNSKRWNAYAGYNPEWMAKLIEIKRIYFNYCMTNERTNKKKFKGFEKPKPSTPAMRLHLVNCIYDAKDILSFSSNSKFIDKIYKTQSDN
ncbi:exonuclease domain-containing protein [Colwellia hornerae]|uniref:DNA-directed DNA polymerase n=1 Tax=Colwellia hornerae TaxID=89402 RepID=A0A5C6QCP0_9GAMM|nr:exonuclease domain-containing protein [Colwellia hornerae]TWX55200.1 hypothetical protein ESZ28_06730 [Colwellia hornerae]TWX61200.1 hypothetical protein ESZ26_05505 [Colwellia hornerae]TWX66450.1 hypothetical protein ESZ27_10510 [Colwellia hornerae]